MLGQVEIKDPAILASIAGAKLKGVGPSANNSGCNDPGCNGSGCNQPSCGD